MFEIVFVVVWLVNAWDSWTVFSKATSNRGVWINDGWRSGIKDGDDDDEWIVDGLFVAMFLGDALAEGIDDKGIEFDDWIGFEMRFDGCNVLSWVDKIPRWFPIQTLLDIHG